MSQSQLAAFMGRRQQTISTWITGKSDTPRKDALRDIARVLKVSPAEVMRAAGYPVEEEPLDEDGVPAWLAEVLTELDAYEQQVVAETARGLLRLREERGAIAPRPEPGEAAPTPVEPPRRPGRRKPQPPAPPA